MGVEVQVDLGKGPERFTLTEPLSGFTKLLPPRSFPWGAGEGVFPLAAFH